MTAVDFSGNESEPSATKSAVVPPGSQPTIRINTGGDVVTAGGVTWSADQYFSGGKSYASANLSASDIDVSASESGPAQVYLTEHSATSDGGSFSYNIPASATGTYTVKLHFAEIYWGAPGGGVGGAGKRRLQREPRRGRGGTGGL